MRLIYLWERKKFNVLLVSIILGLKSGDTAMVRWKVH